MPYLGKNPSTASTPCTLPVIRRKRRNVAHQYRIERADIHAQFQRRRADECVEYLALSLELPLNVLTLHGSYLRRMLLRPHHVEPFTQRHQIIIIRILILELHRSAAAISPAAIIRCSTHMHAPTCPTPLCGAFMSRSASICTISAHPDNCRPRLPVSTACTSNHFLFLISYFNF